jgi:hypothetical protein
MMKPLLSLAVGLSALASLSACNATQLAGALATATGALSGTIYAPQAQVAIVAAGGGNLVGNSGGTYITLSVRSDEVGVGNASVQISKDGATVTTVHTDSKGGFKATVPGGVTYKLVSVFPAKTGGNVTVSGFAQSDASFPIQLGVSHNMVASKLLTNGVTKPDWDAFKAAVGMMDSDLQSVATTPTPNDQATASASFDSIAGSTLKAAVAAMKNMN